MEIEDDLWIIVRRQADIKKSSKDILLTLFLRNGALHNMLHEGDKATVIKSEGCSLVNGERARSQ